MDDRRSGLTGNRLISQSGLDRSASVSTVRGPREFESTSSSSELGDPGVKRHPIGTSVEAGLRIDSGWRIRLRGVPIGADRNPGKPYLPRATSMPLL